MTYYIYNTYSGIQNIVLEKDNQTFFIPISEGNTDYKTYLEWVAEGNEAEEWVAE